MAKGQKRSNREPKKPKRAKQKPPVSATSSGAPARPDELARAKKKW